MSSVKWNGDQCRELFLDEVKARLARGARMCTNYAKKHMGISAIVGTHRGRSRTKGTQRETADRGWVFKGAMQTYKDYEPSAPGDFPRRRTGFLRMSVADEQEGLEARWGTNVPYGRILETKPDRPRPWMSLTNAVMLPELIRLLGGNIGIQIRTSGDE